MEGLPTVRHFSTFPHGGAGAAALGIHQGLQTIGLDSQFYYRRNQSHEPTATDCHAMAFPEATDSDKRNSRIERIVWDDWLGYRM